MCHLVGVSRDVKNLAVSCVFMSECCSGVIILARWSKVRSITKTLLRSPQINALSVILARIWFALVRASAPFLRVLLHDSWSVQNMLSYFDFVDSNVLDAAYEF